MASLASTFYDSTKTATQSIATAWEKATSVAAATLRSMGGVQADQASAPSPVPSEEKPATPSHIRWARMRSGEIFFQAEVSKHDEERAVGKISSALPRHEHGTPYSAHWMLHAGARDRLRPLSHMYAVGPSGVRVLNGDSSVGSGMGSNGGLWTLDGHVNERAEELSQLDEGRCSAPGNPPELLTRPTEASRGHED